MKNSYMLSLNKERACEFDYVGPIESLGKRDGLHHDRWIHKW
jgi:hypothetical protein